MRPLTTTKAGFDASALGGQAGFCVSMWSGNEFDADISTPNPTECTLLAAGRHKPSYQPSHQTSQ